MFIIYYLTYACWFLLSLLPLRMLYVLSDVLYVLMTSVVRYRRKVVRNNIVSSFPEKTTAEHRRIERDFYHFLCDYFVETLKMMTMSERQMRKRMTFTGLEDLHRCLKEGQSAAIYLGHYGCWEWLTSLPYWMPDDVQFAQVYHPLENKRFDKLFKNMREQRGSVSIAMQELPRKLVEYRKAGKVICIGYIADQVPTWTNIHHWLPFLHHDTPVLTGAEKLTRSAGHAVFYGEVTRIARGRYTCSMRQLTRHSKDLPPFEITNIYFRELEKTIRQNPPYWLWSHNRWKRTHEEFARRYKEVGGRVILRNDNTNNRKTI